MMNSPPHFSVEQLLQARQNGVPDYVVVPLLQKTLAVKQALANQAALNAAPQQPPVAQQVLGAAQQDMMQERAGLAALAAQQPPQEGYAQGGILAFANGGLSPEDIAQGEADFGMSARSTPSVDDYQEASPEETFQNALKIGQLQRDFMGQNNYDEEMKTLQEERAKQAEETKARAPWMALMKAGAAMAQSKSPYFMSALGEGLGAGAEELDSQMAAYDKANLSVQEIRAKIAEAKRAEDMAIMNNGMNSEIARQAKKELAYWKHKEFEQRQKETELYHRATIDARNRAIDVNESLGRERIGATYAGIAARKSSGSGSGASLNGLSKEERIRIQADNNIKFAGLKNNVQYVMADPATQARMRDEVGIVSLSGSHKPKSGGPLPAQTTAAPHKAFSYVPQ